MEKIGVRVGENDTALKELVGETQERGGVLNLKTIEIDETLGGGGL